MSIVPSSSKLSSVLSEGEEDTHTKNCFTPTRPKGPHTHVGRQEGLFFRGHPISSRGRFIFRNGKQFPVPNELNKIHSVMAGSTMFFFLVVTQSSFNSTQRSLARQIRVPTQSQHVLWLTLNRMCWLCRMGKFAKD